MEAPLKILDTKSLTLVGTALICIEGKHGPRFGTPGGNLRLAVKQKVENLKEKKQIRAEISLVTTGIPKDEPTDNYAFQTLVIAQAAWEVEQGHETLEFDGDAVKQYLSQPAFLIAATETMQLGEKLGIPNIRLPFDIKELGKPTKMSAGKQKAPVPKKATKRSASKA